MNDQDDAIRHWIPTFSDYIREFIVELNGRHIPGEHHFVSTYLVPRLVQIEGLGVPCYINPDGTKAIPGDIVFYERRRSDSVDEWDLRLGIEVKIGSLIFSRTEYNDWMRPDRSSKPKPHLFVGISRHGMLVGDWDTFSERFVKIAYSGRVPPAELDKKNDAERYTPSRVLRKVVHDTDKVLKSSERPLPDNLHWWEFSLTDAERHESEAIGVLSRFASERITTDKGVAETQKEEDSHRIRNE